MSLVYVYDEAIKQKNLSVSEMVLDRAKQLSIVPSYLRITWHDVSCILWHNNTMIRNIYFLIKSVIYDFVCSDSLTYDKDRFVKKLKLASNWIKTPNDLIKMKRFKTMMIQSMLDDKIKIIKIKFANTAYVSTTNMTLVSSVKLIKQGFDRNMHIKPL